MDDGISALIGRIYEGVHDPRTFQQGVIDLLPLAGARLGLVVATGVAPKPVIEFNIVGDVRSSIDDALGEYDAGLWQDDPTYRFFLANPQARFFDTALHRDPSVHLCDDYTAWNRHRIGGAHWMACHAVRGGPDAFGIALHRRPDEPCFDPRQRELFRMLFEHFERAQSLASRPPDVSQAADAMLVIDRHGRIATASAAAERLLATGDGLHRRDGALACSAPHQQRALDALLGSALTAVLRGGVGGVMVAERPSGRRPLLVVVDPLPDQAALAAYARGALVRIVDPEVSAPPAAVERWRSLWHLTAAETRTAAALVAHEFDLRAAAESVGITYATIRTHLAAIFAKTRTSSQPELMRLLSRVPG